MKKGFTLFEILLAMAILGTIIALTIPKLVDNYTKTTYVRTLQSISDSFKTATTRTFSQERVSSLADSNWGTSAGSYIKKYFKVAADCGTNHTNCLAESYRSLNKSETITTNSMLNSNFYCVAIQSGAAICLTNMSNDTATTRGSSTIVMDINGKKKPNINGRDLFSFNIYTDGKIGNSYDKVSNDANGTTCSSYASTAGYGGACYSKIVADGWKMNY